MINWKTKPCSIVSGTITVPGDKSISHRSIMFGALAEGRTEITGFLQGEDCLATRKAFEAMGVTIRDERVLNSNNEYIEKIVVEGVGLHGLTAPKESIDVGNSGTGMRLLAGLLAGQNFHSTLIGDESLMTRPMKRIAAPLSQMGALVTTLDTGCAPITIEPSPALHGIDYSQNVASAQIKSAILLAGLYADGDVIIREPGISRDHTERMLRQFGYEVKTSSNGLHRTTTLRGGGKLTASNITVPSDISSAAFFMVAGAIAPDNGCGSTLRIKQVGMNPTRTGVVDILTLMGAQLHCENATNSAEPVADIIVASSRLTGIEVPAELVPLAIDEFPVIFVAAACAEGEFVLRNARELRVKESDRIEAMANGLIALGVDCTTLDDGIIIRGNPDNPFPRAAVIDSLTDHRIAMSFAIAGLRAEQGIVIKDCDNVATSFPNFKELAENVGMYIDEVA